MRPSIVKKNRRALTGEGHVADDGVLAVLDSADVLEQRVDDEQDDEAEERHHADHRAEAARVAVAVVPAPVLVPALVRDAAEHDHRKQLPQQTAATSHSR